MDTFSTIAAYYDVLANKARRLEREGPVLLELLGRSPGRRVVDIACGTGLHALFFAEHGAEVTALDVSPQMINYAGRHRPHSRIHYQVADMRRLEGGPWDLAVCLGNSLSLLSTIDELAAVFRSLFQRLEPGAPFLTQILNYRAKAAQEPRHRVERAPLDDGEIFAVKSLVPHGDRTLLALHFFADRYGHFEAASESAVLRNWTYEELSAVARKAGFEIQAVFGGYDKRPYDPETSPDVALISLKT